MSIRSALLLFGSRLRRALCPFLKRSVRGHGYLRTAQISTFELILQQALYLQLTTCLTLQATSLSKRVHGGSLVINGLLDPASQVAYQPNSLHRLKKLEA